MSARFDTLTTMSRDIPQNNDGDDRIMPQQQQAHSRRSNQVIPEYLWRVFHFDQMDWDSTYYQMINIILSPKDVYKSTIFRKQIKNQWARDDPAFVVILMVFIVVTTLAYSVAFGVQSFGHFLRLCIGVVVIEFLLLSFVLASFWRYVANKYMRVQRILSVEQEVEWLYAFDVHCNAFFVLLICGVVEYFLCPIIIMDTFLATLLGNTLVAISLCYYQYMIFLGFDSLPFLNNSPKLLYPIAITLILYVIALILNFNFTKYVLSWYFAH